MSAKYYTVYGFMWDELGLSGNELAVFAVIYSYSSDGRGRFLGSRSVLGQMVGRSVREVDRVLGRLVERGFLVKHREQSRSGVSYSVAPQYFESHKKQGVTLPSRQHNGGDEMAHQVRPDGTPGETRRHTRCDEMAHNNKSYNKSYNKSTINGRGGAQERSYRYNFMTKEEYKRWAEEAFWHAQNRPLDDDDDD